MGTLLDHIRSVNSDRDTKVHHDAQNEYSWTDETGAEIIYQYDARVVRKGGDERQDDEGRVYFIPIEHLPEFDYHDETIEINADFWVWMDGFIERNNLTSVRQQRQRAQVVKAEDWGFGGAWDKGKKFLSDWWGGSKFFSDYGTDDAKKYSIALQAVKSTVRVIDSHSRRLSVELSDSDMQKRRDGGEDFSPTSLTDFGTRRIIVSACALADKALEQGDGIDITTGFALHEASHGEYTEDVFPALEQPTRLKPLATSGFLLNVAEDIRIEHLTSEKFPGFEGYFDKTNDYMWTQFMVPHVPDAWGPELTDKLNAVVSIAKWPTQFEPIARADAILSDEFDWWTDWKDRYLNGKVKPRQALVEAVARLAEDPQTQQELEKQAKDEDAMRLDQMALADALEQALQQMPNLMKPCSSITGRGDHAKGLDVKLPHTTADRAQRYADEQLQEDPVITAQFPSGPGAPGTIVTLRPLEDEASRKEYKPPSASVVQRMKASFLMRPSAMEWTDRLQKGGSVDEDEIWRAGAGDMRFFERRTVESAPDTSVAILVDSSGSMNGRKLRNAADTASIIHSCTKDMRGVRVRVYAHTGDNGDSGNGNAAIYRIWERGEPVSRLGTIMTQQKGDNYDGYALGWVVNDLMKNSTPEEQQIVFVISDGLPNGYGEGGNGWGGGYGGEEAMNHVRSVVSWAERMGVDVIQIAIDAGISPDEQAQMYKHWLPYEGPATLPQQVMGVLKKLM